MSDFDDLDSLLGPLREPATPAELASERTMVDLMVTTHRHAKGTPMFNSRRARVATLIAAGVIGFGGVAAAGGGLSRAGTDDTPDVDPAPLEIEVEEIEEEVEEVEVEEVTTTTAATEVEESDDDMFTDEVAKATLAAAAAVDDEAVANAIEDACVAENNHGQNVSAVAHNDDSSLEVRDMARSDCGKPGEESDEDADGDADAAEDDNGDEESADDDNDDGAAADDEDDSGDEVGGGSNGGNGNGGNHGNGNGNHGGSGNDD